MRFDIGIFFLLYIAALFTYSPVFATSMPQRNESENAKCLMCHSAKSFTKESAGKSISLFVDSVKYANSVHGDQACIDCHTDLIDTKFPHQPTLATVSCGRCHDTPNHTVKTSLSPYAQYTDSVHGKALSQGNPNAPLCSDCHGTHDILSTIDPKSPVNRANIPRTCTLCHVDEQTTTKMGGLQSKLLKKYQQSVHGKALNKLGTEKGAVCTDCHGAHDIKLPSDPASSVNKRQISATCGQCHQETYQEYTSGIHGQAIIHGKLDAPVCTDCHGEHSIKASSDKFSTVNATNIQVTCSKCHEDMGIIKTYGLATNRLGSYADSYHGVANKFGETTVANCASCHEAHQILPSSDPKSSVNKKNIPVMCGKCHPKAGTNFAKGTVHVNPSRNSDALLYWIRIAYTVFIYGVISFFCIFIVLDLRYRIALWLRHKRTRHSRGVGNE